MLTIHIPQIVASIIIVAVFLLLAITLVAHLKRTDEPAPSKDFVWEYFRTSPDYTIESYTNSRTPNTDVWYGKAKGNIVTDISWCTEGHSCTYEGKPIDKNISLTMFKDGKTRRAFNGYVFDTEHLITILTLTH